MTLFERIKKIAKIRGLSLRDVAIKAGFKSETAIYRYNQGVHPRETTLVSIADALDTTVEYLKGETENYNPQSSNTKTADLADDDVIFTYKGKPLSDEDKELINRLMNGKD